MKLAADDSAAQTESLVTAGRLSPERLENSGISSQRAGLFCKNTHPLFTIGSSPHSYSSSGGDFGRGNFQLDS